MAPGCAMSPMLRAGSHSSGQLVSPTTRCAVLYASQGVEPPPPPACTDLRVARVCVCGRRRTGRRCAHASSLPACARDRPERHELVDGAAKRRARVGRCWRAQRRRVVRIVGLDLEGVVCSMAWVAHALRLRQARQRACSGCVGARTPGPGTAPGLRCKPCTHQRRAGVCPCCCG
jgi:hypothetical protein